MFSLNRHDELSMLCVVWSLFGLSWVHELSKRQRASLVDKLKRKL